MGHQHNFRTLQDISLSLYEIKELLISTGGGVQCQRGRDLLKEKLSELETGASII